MDPTMSFDRWYFPCLRLTSVLAFVLVATVCAQADDNWHNVYHSLKRFFTGKSSTSSTPVHHRVRRSEDHQKTNPSTEPTPSTADRSHLPDASATPRVVILPATSPTTEAAPGTENSVGAPEAVVKPEPSPDSGPVLRSLSAPTPLSTPIILPSPTPRTGNTATN
jgi:hypothetical protein